jgi:hypothetical protein
MKSTLQRAALTFAGFFGSAREFDETRILGCFLKNEEFGLGGCHTLSLEQ